MDSLGGVVEIVAKACKENNEWVTQQQQVRERLRSNPDESVAAYLSARGFTCKSPVFQSFDVLSKAVEHHVSLARMKDEWESYTRGLRTNKKVWFEFFRSDFPEESNQFISGDSATLAFNANVTFANIQDNPLWHLGRSSIDRPPQFISLVGRALRFGRSGEVAAAAAVVSSNVNLIVADEGLGETLRKHLLGMDMAYADKLSQHNTNVLAIRKTHQALNLDGMLASLQTDAFEKLAQPRDSSMMMRDYRSDVSATVDEWLRLMANAYENATKQVQVEAKIEKQILSAMRIEGYTESIRTAQRSFYVRTYHREMSALYSSICHDISTKCKAAAVCLGDTASAKFRTILHDAETEAMSEYHAFLPDCMPPVDPVGRQLLLDHYHRVSQLDGIKTRRQILQVFEERLRSVPQHEETIEARFKSMAKTAMGGSVETVNGAEWIRENESMVLSLGLGNEVAGVMPDGKSFTYEQLLKQFGDAVEQVLQPAWAEYSRCSRPVPTIPAFPTAAFLVDSEPVLKIIHPIASALLKRPIPSDIDPSEGIKLRLALDSVIGAKTNEKRKMDQLCIFILHVAQGLLIHGKV